MRRVARGRTNVDVRLGTVVGGVCAVGAEDAGSVLGLDGTKGVRGVLGQALARGAHKGREGTESDRHGEDLGVLEKRYTIGTEEKGRAGARGIRQVTLSRALLCR